VPFQSYTVGVSAVSFDLVASQPLVLLALYFVSFHEIMYVKPDPSSTDGNVTGACQSSLLSSVQDAKGCGTINLFLDASYL